MKLAAAPAKGGATFVPETGTLVVELLPSEGATVDGRKLGFGKIAVEREPFVARHLPAGTHKITFCNPDRCLDHKVELRPGSVASLVVDFVAPEIRDVSEVRRAQWVARHDACERGRAPVACLEACRTDLALDPDRPSRSCGVLFGVAP